MWTYVYSEKEIQERLWSNELITSIKELDVNSIKDEDAALSNAFRDWHRANMQIDNAVITPTHFKEANANYKKELNLLIASLSQNQQVRKFIAFFSCQQNDGYLLKIPNVMIGEFNDCDFGPHLTHTENLQALKNNAVSQQMQVDLYDNIENKRGTKLATINIDLEIRPHAAKGAEVFITGYKLAVLQDRATNTKGEQQPIQDMFPYEYRMRQKAIRAVVVTALASLLFVVPGIYAAYKLRHQLSNAGRLFANDIRTRWNAWFPPKAKSVSVAEKGNNTYANLSRGDFPPGTHAGISPEENQHKKEKKKTSDNANQPTESNNKTMVEPQTSHTFSKN